MFSLKAIKTALIDPILNVPIRVFYLLVIWSALVMLCSLYILTIQSHAFSSQIMELEEQRFKAIELTQEFKHELDDINRATQLFFTEKSKRYFDLFNHFCDAWYGKNGLVHDDALLYSDTPNSSPTILLNIKISGSIITRLSALPWNDKEKMILNTLISNANLMIQKDRQAVFALEGIKPDKQGNYRIQSKPSDILAKHLLHDDAYNQARFLTSHTLIELITSMNDRTQLRLGELETLLTKSMFISKLIIYSIILLCLYALVFVKFQVLIPLKDLLDQSTKITGGDYSVHNAVTVKNEVGTLGHTQNLMCDAINNDINEHKRLEIELLQHEHEAVTINKMNEMLQICHATSEAVTVITLNAQEIFPNMSGGLTLYNYQNRQLDTVSTWGPHPFLKSSFTANDCWALRGGHNLIISNPEKTILCNHLTSQEHGAYICIPLLSQNETIGTFHLYQSNASAITETEQQLIITFSEVIKLSLANIRLREELHEQAIRDALTGLFNRRYLDATLPRELRRVLRDKKPLTIAMIDVDHFKHINDTYGHKIGDQVLEAIGKILQDNVRGSDIACRYGGEEFLLVFFNSDLKDAIARLTNLCDLIKDIAIQHENQIIPQITASIGVTQAPQDGTHSESLIRNADEALYTAKENGRDQIVIYTPALKS